MMKNIIAKRVFTLGIKFNKMNFCNMNQNKRKEAFKEDLMKEDWELNSTRSNLKRNKKDKIEEIYTKEEMNSLHTENKIVKIMEISEKNFKKIRKYKSFALYFNLPLAIVLPILNEFYLSGWAETSSEANMIYHLLFVVDVMCFGGAVGGIYGLRNVVVLANYLTNEKKVQFTKLNFLKKPYIITCDPAEMNRVTRTPFTPFISLKNPKTKEDFSLSGIGKWYDVKLYNTLFPHPEQRRKEENIENNDK